MKNVKSSPGASAKVLRDKAESCLQISRAQHESAQKQHRSADKLHDIARGLKSDAAEIENRSLNDMDSARD